MKLKTPATLYLNKIILPALLAGAALLTACGGGGGGSDNPPANNPGDGSGGNDGAVTIPEGTAIPQVTGLTGDADYQGLLYYTMTTDSEKEPDASASTGPDKYKLVAVNPSLSPVVTETVSTNLQKLSSYRGVALSFPKADIDASARTLSNYHMDRILFQKKISGSQFEKKIITTDSSQWPPVAQNVTSNLKLYGISLSQYDLQNPSQSVVLSGSYGANNFKQLQVKTSATLTTFADASVDSLSAQAPIMDGANHKPKGWLVFSRDNSNDEYRLLQYKLDGTLLGEVKDEGGQPVVKTIRNGITLQPFPGGVFADGTHLVVLEQEQASSNPYPPADKVVYKFTPGASGSLGSLTKLRNSQNKPLKLPIKNILLDRVVMSKDAVYMAMDTSGSNAGSSIYRLDKNGWEEIVQTKSRATPLQMKLAGHYLVWSAPTEASNDYENTLFSYNTKTGDVIALDNEIDASDLQRDKPAEVVNLGDPMYGNADGRIYYGRKRAMEIKVGEITIGSPPYETTTPQYETKYWVEAVVRNADGTGTPVVIKDAMWIGASTNGKGTVQAQVTLAQIKPRAGGGIFPRGRTKGMELSEVFFIKGVETESANSTTELVNPKLFAVSATDPAAGMVKLGDLPADTYEHSFSFLGLNGWNDITGELGAGPHRLLTIRRPDTKRSVLYVNTRQENSLTVLDTSNGTGSSNAVREVRGF